MQIIRKGECDGDFIGCRFQAIRSRQKRSSQRSVLLRFTGLHVLGYRMLGGVVYSLFAGFFKRCPAFFRVFAAVFRHSVLLGKCLNGAQIDLAFLNGIIANKPDVFQRICIIICGLLVCSNVYALFGGAIGVEQRIEIALRSAARRTEFLDAWGGKLFKILVAVVSLLQRLVEICCVQLRRRN